MNPTDAGSSPPVLTPPARLPPPACPCSSLHMSVLDLSRSFAILGHIDPEFGTRLTNNPCARLPTRHHTRDAAKQIPRRTEKRLGEPRFWGRAPNSHFAPKICLLPA